MFRDDYDEVLKKAGSDIVDEVTDVSSILISSGILSNIPKDSVSRLAAAGVNIFCSLVEMYHLVSEKTRNNMYVILPPPDMHETIKLE